MADLSKLPTLIAAEDWAGAEKLLRRAAQAQKPAPEVFYNLGKVLMERGQAKQAVSWFRKAVLARPSYAAAWFELGRAALGADDLQGACDGFARAVALAPGDADARLNLARLLLRLGDWEKAEALWRSIDADEAKPALFRAAAEMGKQAQARRLLEAMMEEPQLRPAALKAMTRTAKGQIPLSAPGS